MHHSNREALNFCLHLSDFEFLRSEIKKGDVLLEFSSVKWVLYEDHTLY